MLSESILKAHHKSSLMFYTSDVVIQMFNKSITTPSSGTTTEDKEIKAMSQLLNHSQISPPKLCPEGNATKQHMLLLNLPV